MSCQRQEGDSLLAEWISLISKLFVRFNSAGGVGSSVRVVRIVRNEHGAPKVIMGFAHEYGFCA